jgi:hypothetical protein
MLDLSPCTRVLHVALFAFGSRMPLIVLSNFLFQYICVESHTKEEQLTNDILCYSLNFIVSVSACRNSRKRRTMVNDILIIVLLSLEQRT